MKQDRIDFWIDIDLFVIDAGGLDDFLIGLKTNLS